MSQEHRKRLQNVKTAGQGVNDHPDPQGGSLSPDQGVGGGEHQREHEKHGRSQSGQRAARPRSAVNSVYQKGEWNGYASEIYTGGYDHLFGEILHKKSFTGRLCRPLRYTI